MSECKGVAGVGITINREIFEKLGKKELFDDFEESENTDEDPESFFKKLFEKHDCYNIKYKYAGNLFTGEIKEYLFAKDPIAGVSQFIYDMEQLGFAIVDECELEFISDFLIF